MFRPGIDKITDSLKVEENQRHWLSDSLCCHARGGTFTTCTIVGDFWMEIGVTHLLYSLRAAVYSNGLVHDTASSDYYYAPL
jgi:hypothetical protein